MTKAEFEILSKSLQSLSKTIPLNWGRIQNDITDSKINLFGITTKIELENEIKQLSEADKNYFRRRWFLWQCSKVDEHLFYQNENVRQNPSSRDQNWDIEFHNNKALRFDVKGTVVPKRLRQNFTVSDEQKIIDFYYQNQSRGVRDHIQNRLFIVHHSFYKEERSLFLRCYWDLKQKAYQHFIDLTKASTVNFLAHNTVKAKCIFILESKTNEFSFHIN